tara:strand:- start:1228 stop:1782 length:555 start_codon:yes stop_codon:yes gene_type:complete
MKHLVISGYNTNDNFNQDDIRIHKVDSVGIGNLAKCRGIIYLIGKLIKSGVNKDKIEVIVSWSSIDKKDYFFCKQKYKNLINTHHNVINKDIMYVNLSTEDKTNNFLLKDIKNTYYKYFNDESENLLNTLETIVQLQDYLLLNNIDYKMSGWQINPLLKYVYPRTKYMWDMIEWSNWVGYEDFN